MLHEHADAILAQLHKNGYEAYYVGGCVRDYLLGQPFNDIDIATNATPEMVMQLFKHSIPTGINYGTITVLKGDASYEITTYRNDLNYIDGRRPTAVSFSTHIQDDLARRDFTMNAIAMSIDGELIDPFNGKTAIDNKIIETVGLAMKRFKEDKLRKLRAVRFAAQKNFKLSSSLKMSLIDDPDLSEVSAERIFNELDKLLVSNHPDIGLRLLAETKLIDAIHPVFLQMYQLDQQNPYHKYDVFEHTIQVVMNTPKKSKLRWAALLHDIGKPACKIVDEHNIGHFYGHEKVSTEIARDILNTLKVSNVFKKEVLHLIRHHAYFPKQRAKPLRRFIKKIGKDHVDDLLHLMRADAMGKGTALGMSAEKIDQLRYAVNDVLNTTPPLALKDLAINGSDLLSLMPELRHNKKRIGIILNALLETVLDDPKLNEKPLLTKLALQMQTSSSAES